MSAIILPLISHMALASCVALLGFGFSNDLDWSSEDSFLWWKQSSHLSLSCKKAVDLQGFFDLP